MLFNVSVRQTIFVFVCAAHEPKLESVLLWRPDHVGARPGGEGQRTEVYRHQTVSQSTVAVSHSHDRVEGR